MASDKPRLTLAIADHDLNHGLIHGQVQTDTLDLEVLWDIEDGERNSRMLRERPYDASEFSLANYLVAKSRGLPFDAIPAFPNRKFRHSYIFCNTSSGIREPLDLHGKKVGLRGWATTVSLWVRGILQRFYGLELPRVTWFSTSEPLTPDLPPGVVVNRLRPEQDLDAMLVSGELDAVIYPDVLPSIQRGAPEVRRLFEDYKAAEQEFFRRTRIFPISHLVALKAEVAQQYPHAPLALLHAFRQSRDICFRRLEDQQVLGISWTGSLLADQRALMGPNYWPYDVEHNRLPLQTIIDFAHQQGLTTRPLQVEELFLRETVESPGW